MSCYQDITGIFNELPKLPSHVSVVKVIRSGLTAKVETISNALTVNRHKVHCIVTSK
jgi:hypothetical protein